MPYQYEIMLPKFRVFIDGAIGFYGCVNHVLVSASVSLKSCVTITTGLRWESVYSLLLEEA